MNLCSQIDHVRNKCFVTLVYDMSVKIHLFMLSHKTALNEASNMHAKKKKKKHQQKQPHLH